MKREEPTGCVFLEREKYSLAPLAYNKIKIISMRITIHDLLKKNCSKDILSFTREYSFVKIYISLFFDKKKASYLDTINRTMETAM